MVWGGGAEGCIGCVCCPRCRQPITLWQAGAIKGGHMATASAGPISCLPEWRHDLCDACLTGFVSRGDMHHGKLLLCVTWAAARLLARAPTMQRAVVAACSQAGQQRVTRGGRGCHQSAWQRLRPPRHGCCYPRSRQVAAHTCIPFRGSGCLGGGLLPAAAATLCWRATAVLLLCRQ
jgi:hypothetical protein